jgi:hypothetical protein
LPHEYLESTVCANVDLNIDPFSVFADKFIRMTRVTVHVLIAVGSTTVRKENQNLVDALGVLREVVLRKVTHICIHILGHKASNTETNPKHVGVLKMCLRVALLGVNEVGELGGVAKEKDWSIVEDPIEVAFVCANFDSETAGVTGSICRAIFSTNGRETDSGTSPVADLFEEGGTSKIGDIMSYIEIAVRAGTLGMNL